MTEPWPDDLELAVERFEATLKWSDEATDSLKTLIIGNVRGFAGMLRRERAAALLEAKP